MYGTSRKSKRNTNPKRTLRSTNLKVTNHVYKLRSTFPIKDNLEQFATTNKMKIVMQVDKNEFRAGNIDKIDYYNKRITIKYKKKTLGVGKELWFDEIRSTLIFLNDDKTIYKPKCGYLSDKSLIDRFKQSYDKYSEKLKDPYSSSEKKEQRKMFVEESYKEYQKNPDKMILYLETEDCIVTKQLLDAKIPLPVLRPCNNDDIICEMIQQQHRKIRVLKEDIKKVFQANSKDYCSVWFDLEELQSSFGDSFASSSSCFKGFVMINLSTRTMRGNDVVKTIRDRLLRNACNVNARTYQGRSGITNMACGWGHMASCPQKKKGRSFPLPS